MGFFTVLTAAVVAAIIVAMLVTMNSNYLDPNINTSLDLTNKLKLRGTFTTEDKRANNFILRNKLSTLEKWHIITEEMDRRNRTQNQTSTPSSIDTAAPAVASSSKEKTSGTK